MPIWIIDEFNRTGSIYDSAFSIIAQVAKGHQQIIIRDISGLRQARKKMLAVSSAGDLIPGIEAAADAHRGAEFN